MTAAILRDLARAKLTFQLHTLATIINQPPEAPPNDQSQNPRPAKVDGIPDILAGSR